MVVRGRGLLTHDAARSWISGLAERRFKSASHRNAVVSIFVLNRHDHILFKHPAFRSLDTASTTSRFSLKLCASTAGTLGSTALDDSPDFSQRQGSISNRVLLYVVLEQVLRFDAVMGYTLSLCLHHTRLPPH